MAHLAQAHRLQYINSVLGEDRSSNPAPGSNFPHVKDWTLEVYEHAVHVEHGGDGGELRFPPFNLFGVATFSLDPALVEDYSLVGTLGDVAGADSPDVGVGDWHRFAGKLAMPVVAVIDSDYLRPFEARMRWNEHVGPNYRVDPLNVNELRSFIRVIFSARDRRPILMPQFVEVGDEAILEAPWFLNMIHNLHVTAMESDQNYKITQVTIQYYRETPHFRDLSFNRQGLAPMQPGARSRHQYRIRAFRKRWKHRQYNDRDLLVEQGVPTATTISRVYPATMSVLDAFFWAEVDREMEHVVGSRAVLAERFNAGGEDQLIPFMLAPSRVAGYRARMAARRDALAGVVRRRPAPPPPEPPIDIDDDDFAPPPPPPPPRRRRRRRRRGGAPVRRSARIARLHPRRSARIAALRRRFGGTNPFVDDEVEVADDSDAILDESTENEFVDDDFVVYSDVAESCDAPSPAALLFKQQTESSPAPEPSPAPAPALSEELSTHRQRLQDFPDLHNNCCVPLALLTAYYTTARKAIFSAPLGSNRWSAEERDVFDTEYTQWMRDKGKMLLPLKRGKPWQNAAVCLPARRVVDKCVRFSVDLVNPYLPASATPFSSKPHEVTKESGKTVSVPALNRGYAREDLAAFAQALSDRFGSRVCIQASILKGDGRSSQLEMVNWEEGSDQQDVLRIGIVLNEETSHASIVYDTNISHLVFHGGKKGQKLCEMCNHTYWPSSTAHICQGLEACKSCGLPSKDREHTAAYRSGENCVTCTDCFSVFGNQECFDSHKQPRTKSKEFGLASLCTLRYHCPRGLQEDGTIDLDARCSNHYFQNSKKISEARCPRESHDCSTPLWCDSCSRKVGVAHGCLLKPAEAVEPNPNLLFCDFETTQVDVYTDKYGAPRGMEHQVNLAVTMKASSDDWHVVHRSVSEWLSWLTSSPELDGHTVIFHNGKGFDCQFILRELFTNSLWFDKFSGVRESLRFRGNDIMTFTLSTQETVLRPSPQGGRPRRVPKWSVRFVDSLCFIESSIRKFPKMFGLSEDLRKGDFPHLFNTRDMPDVLPSVPPLEKYFVDRGDNTSLLEFAVDHAEKVRAGREWRPWEELKAYCLQDVRVHRAGCLKFRELMMSITQHPERCPEGLDPFQYMTKAQYGKAVFEVLCLEPDTLGCETPEMIDIIRLAFAGGRVEAFSSYFDATKQNLSVGHGLEEDYADIVVDHDAEETQLRTSGFRMYGADFCSLYPTVQKYDLYPTGAPKLFKTVQLSSGQSAHEFVSALVNRADKLSVVCVDVGCPESDDVVPLLWEKKFGKLMFDFTPKRHKWYSSCELAAAIDVGYTVTDVHSYVEWPGVKRGLFASYVDKFLKIKHEASGWPSSCRSADDRAAYLARIKEIDGVELDEESVCFNPGLRVCAKVLLNCLWGKYAQKVTRDQQNHMVINEKDEEGMLELHQAIAERRIKNVVCFGTTTALVSIETVSPLSDKEISRRQLLDEAPDRGWSDPDLTSLVSTTADGSVKPEVRELKGFHGRPGGVRRELVLDRQRNTGIAVFTTAWARLRLYERLSACGVDRIAYCDTDSLYIRVKPGEDPQSFLPLGEGLGALTNEVGPDKYSFDNTHVDKFWSGGPKSYMMRTRPVEVDLDSKIMSYIHHLLVSGKLYELQHDDLLLDLAQRSLGRSDSLFSDDTDRNEQFQSYVCSLRTDPGFLQFLNESFIKRKVKGLSFHMLTTRQTISPSVQADIYEGASRTGESEVKIWKQREIRKLDKTRPVTTEVYKMFRANNTKRASDASSESNFDEGWCPSTAWRSNSDFAAKRKAKQDEHKAARKSAKSS